MSSKQARRQRTRKSIDVRKILRAFVVELRKILKRAGPETYRRFPNMRRPCATCAFNPATDNWKGADKTAMGLQKAIANDQPFYCHEGMRIGRDGEYDPSTALELFPCGGWLAVVGEPETKTAFMRAALGPGCDGLAETLVLGAAAAGQREEGAR